ncbi:LuxR C-terminal-related transcriptional regulator [Streptacidiphilus pinicola]|uniref:LuxR C-terminal-related transcriptional regulator n=1 Tax=Streptacidiphilus pinicola TaxID=2219663 RepID=UPI001A9CCA31|nr:LuxR C-terminal-related transcriptional regulator [Streptacidiphilus pinicola]
MPADLTSFVGRRQDVAAVRELASKARLVTLTGIGGVGKTRLAFRVAAEVRRAFPDGVCLVELASLTDPALLPLTVMDALAMREQSAREPVGVLCDHLRTQHMLLVLDNCEHLVEAVADLADRLLRAAPDLRILATSRQALRIAGEYVYPVLPLPVPNPEATIKPGTGTQYPSVTLLAERSAAVVPGFALTPDNEAAVIRLCHRLEGIPLAIELAAVRLRALTVDDLVNRLDDRFDLLREGNRNLPERHQTLQAMIDWSYGLCTPTEQALWARASVFAGGFGTDALEAVCTDDSLPERAVLDAVTGLVEKSIFVPEPQGGRSRFRMLETIREYGQARLAESGDQEALDRRHRDWCLQLIETAGDEWVGPRQQQWADRLELEHANLRRALEYCLSESGEARVGLRMAAVPWFWGATEYIAEGRLWLDRLLALDEEPSHERAWALATAAYIAIFQGDEHAVTVLPEVARDLAVRLDDPAALAYATHVLGMRQSLSDDPASAIPLFTEALEQYSETGVTPQYPDSLRIELANAYILLGDFDKATNLVDELYELCGVNGDRWNLSYALWGRGFLALIRGDLDQAEADLCESLAMKREFHDTLGLALTLEVLAWTAAAQGEDERAATLSGGADSLRQSIGAKHVITAPGDFQVTACKRLGEAAFDSAFARGRHLALDETLALALREHAQPAPAAPAQASLLTRRQREVAELVAAGLSNKEIAAKLVISLRTAEGHVESILTKLDFKTRTQIAHWVMQQPTGQARE